MLELLGNQVDQGVNIDFNEVYQRMTLDAIGEWTVTASWTRSNSRNRKQT